MELSIVQFLNHLGQGKIDFLTNFISWIPFIITLWAALAFWALWRDKKQGKAVFAAVVLALILHFIFSEGLLKHLLINYMPMRVRPYLAYPELIKPIGKMFVDSSFPSSHMASTLAVLTVLVFFYRKTWPFALAFVILMAFSRIHNGMHYPTDVLAGSILGVNYGVASLGVVGKIALLKAKE